MADQPVSPVRPEESATTREEMDFDDNENEQETGTVSPLGHETPTKSTASPNRKNVSFQTDSTEAPPPKPPRPLSPQTQAENTLIEAFPSIDTKVIKAVLVASGGQVEPAFNALLGMSDPDFQPDARGQQQTYPPRQTSRVPMTQLEADEMYARQLADQYDTANPRGQTRYNQREPARRGPNQQMQGTYDQEANERNFFDDELPEIGRNIQQGFFDTQKKVNSWFQNFKKRIDGEESDDEDLYSGVQGNTRANTAANRGSAFAGRQNFGPSQSEQLYGIQKQAEAQQRRSTEANRYDADPHELGEDEFERLELRDDEAESAPPPMPPRTSSRSQGTQGRMAPNPDLFKSAPTKPPQSGPVDEVEAAGDQTADGKAKKWQSLTSVAPNPEDDDHDPFSLGDDDDDKGQDLRKEDSQRLKEAARNSISGEPPKTLEEAGRSGSQNQEALDLLAEKK